MNKLKLDKNKLLLIGIVLIVIIGIPLTILQSQKQQEIRQRASEIEQEVEEPKVTLTLKCKEDFVCDNVEIGDKFSVELRLENTGMLDISGFMTTINYDPILLELSNFSPELRKPTEGRFDSIIDSTLEDPPTPGVIQYAAVNFDIEREITDTDILLGTLTFKGIGIDEARLTFEETETQVTALGREEALEVDLQADETFTIVPIPEKSISVDLVVRIDGISSDTPAEIPRPFKIRPVGAVDEDEDGVVLTENLTFDTQSNSFKGQTHIPEDFPPGNYTIQTRKTLRKFIGFIDPSQNIVIPQVSLALGDVDETNSIDILDFNIISDCFGNLFRSGKCLEHALHLNADLDEDGEVTGIDYNLFVRSLAIRQGD